MPLDIQPNVINNVELEKKKKSWEGIYNALDYLFDGGDDKFINSALKYYLSEEGGKNRLFYSLLLRGLLFAIFHPIHTYNLYKFKSENVSKDKEFQKGLLDRESFHKFLKNIPDKNYSNIIGEYIENKYSRNYPTIYSFRESATNLYQIIPQILKHNDIIKDIIEIMANPIEDKQQKYLLIAKKIFEITATDEAVVRYFKENHAVFRGFLRDVLRNIDGVDEYNLNGDLYYFVPHLLNNSQKMIEIINHIQKEEKISALLQLRKMIKEDSELSGELKEQFEQNREKLVNYLNSLIEKKYPLLGNHRELGNVLLEAFEQGIYTADKFVSDLESLQKDSERQREFEKQLKNNSILDVAEQNQTKKKAKKQKPIVKIDFKNVSIIRKDLSSMEFIGTAFDNAVIADSSFNKSKFTNVSFKNVSFENVSFKGATIDAPTLKSMLESLDTVPSSLELNGAKLIGDLSGLNLTGLSLVGADFTGVTSLKGAIFKDADLTDAKLPEFSILSEAYDIEAAQKNEEVFSAEQEEKLLSKSEVDKKDIIKKLKESRFPHNQKLADYLINKISEANEIDIDYDLPIDFIRNVNDYKDNTKLFAAEVYHNLENPYVLELNIAADAMADKLVQNLFGEGDNRGLDGYNIRMLMRRVVDELLRESKLSINDIIEIKDNEIKLTDKMKEIVGEIKFNAWGKVNATGLSKTIYDQTKYTGVGLVSGGIYLPEEAIDPLKRSIISCIKTLLGKDNSEKHQNKLLEKNSQVDKEHGV